MEKLPIGYIQKRAAIDGLGAAFADARCAGIFTDDVTTEIRAAILSLTSKDIDKMRGLEICLRNGTVCAHIQNRPYYPIGHESVQTLYGLPLALQFLLKSDFEDHANYTGTDARTRIVIGGQLELDWHADITRSGKYPIQHRNLSPKGMQVVTSANGLELPYKRLNTTAFFHAVAINQQIAKGTLEKRELEMGERILFRDNCVHRSPRIPGDKTPYALQVRAITSYHPTRA